MIIGLLINLLIVILIFGAVWLIIDLLPIDGRFKLAARLIVALILLLYLLRLLPVYGGPHGAWW